MPRPPIVASIILFNSNRKVNDMASVKVEVKPWYESKVNWTQIIAVGASIATVFGITVPEDIVPQTVAVITSIQAFLTVVFKVWFTKTVTPQSMNKV